MKFADWVNGWWVLAISVAIPAGITVALWVMRSGIGDVWISVAWGGSVFGIVLTAVYLVGLFYRASR